MREAVEPFALSRELDCVRDEPGRLAFVLVDTDDDPAAVDHEGGQGGGEVLPAAAFVADLSLEVDRVGFGALWI